MTNRIAILSLVSCLLLSGGAGAMSAGDICATEWRNGNFDICEKAAAAKPQDVPTLRNLARAYIEVADFSAALEIYEKVALIAPQDPQVFDDLAGTYGFVRAYSSALTALNRAMALRPPRTEDFRALAIMYINLNDRVRAVEMTQRAAEMGDPIAMFDMRRYYRDGFGVAPDLDKSVEWTVKAADAGHLGAMSLLSEIYLDGLYGQTPDEAKAILWAERLRAAEKSI